MPFPAKYPGVCATCGSPIEVGEQIETALGRGYSHYGHDRTDTAMSVTLKAQEPKKPRGVNKVPDGTLGTCERCTAVAIVNSVKITGRQKSIQVCVRCHSAMVSPLRSRSV